MTAADPEIQRLLGPVLRQHRVRWTYITATVAGTVLFGAMTCLALYRFAVDMLKDPSGETVLLGVLLTLPFLIPALLLGFWTYRRVARVLTVHQGGFQYRDSRGESVVPWTSIDGVYQKIVRVYRAGQEVDVRDEYTLSLHDGTRITVDYHMDDIESFGTTLNDVLTEIALPSQRDAFRRGHPLDFGIVRLDGHGVHIHDKSLAWPEVQSISWKEGLLSSSEAYLMIRRHGGLLAWSKLPIEQVKNYPVLMAIAADMGKAQ